MDIDQYKQKVNVVVRVRPLIDREKDDEGELKLIEWNSKPEIVLVLIANVYIVCVATKITWVVDSTSISNKEKEDCSFTFDKVYGQESTTEQIYNDVVAPIVKDAFNGFNGTILCYGQTSSGECGMSSGGEVEWLQGCSCDNYSN
jgi:hypothetical protein